MARKIRIYLIDDHAIVRDSMARAIADQSDLEVVGEAGTASDGLAGAIAARPEVVVVDLHLPDQDGPELIAALRSALPDARLLVVSGYDDEFRVTEALRAGAHGYLLKASRVEQLIGGLRDVAAGGTPLSPALTEGVLRAMRKTSRSGNANAAPGTTTIDVLSAREIQVLRLFAMGHSTRDVALSLGISPKTVETHRVRIYDKLGCKGIVDLTRIAMRTGLVQA